ncbi:DUF4920 domain-containing protein [Hymenobacter latericus]|uniref:DUF4920 domain-containing protein n=1 Tax=Hymenobacter sp. YIM 151858-1 TaxID=2987688 RepID=UPI0022273983|nr:DUF4920 domain-containing protein [Hymenobacter sp. YIM 151858-1]UYZ60352.1 DUF4920 domain-containing protein [Hymenobacter sp. YIM 151858-1]
MKRTLTALALALLALGTCQAQTAPGKATTSKPAASAVGKTYGAATTAEGAQPVSALPGVLGTRDSVQVKLVGQITEVCAKKGCWMKMQTADGKQMQVRFKDYGFFVPADLKGRTVVIDGWARREVMPVAKLQHYAQDAGKSAKEVAAITKDEEQINFIATGVLVKK